jgi:large subunit ribosomal protein L5
VKLDFRALYKQDIFPMMTELFGYTDGKKVPKLVKVSLNRGSDPSTSGTSDMKKSEDELSLIAGQKPYLRKARKSVSAFKIREGMHVGLAVNLRGARMYAFLAKLVHVILPRVRDFRGLNWEGFDRSGNYNFGVDDQLVFPEVSYDDVKKVRGVGLSLVTSSETDEEADYLLTAFGFIFTPHPFLGSVAPRPGWSGDSSSYSPGEIQSRVQELRSGGDKGIRPLVSKSPSTLTWAEEHWKYIVRETTELVEVHSTFSEDCEFARDKDKLNTFRLPPIGAEYL